MSFVPADGAEAGGGVLAGAGVLVGVSLEGDSACLRQEGSTTRTTIIDNAKRFMDRPAL